MKKRKVSIKAFNLVELVMAIGVVSFCLVALFGLFSVGLNNSRKSNEDTALASMVMSRISTLRTVGISAFSTNLFFSFDGEQTTNSSQAYFECQFLTNSMAGAEPNLATVALKFTWPVLPNGASPNTNTVYATLAP